MDSSAEQRRTGPANDVVQDKTQDSESHSRTLEEELAAAQTLALDERLLEADDILLGLDQRTEDDSSPAASWRQFPWVVELQRKAKRHRELTQDLQCDKGWTQMHCHDDITVWYRAEEDSLFHSVRIDVEMDTSVFGAIAVMNEVDLWNLWVPSFNFPMRVGLRTSHQIKQISRASQSIYCAVNAPWPFKSRDAVLHAHGCDRLQQHRQITVVVDSLPQEASDQSTLWGSIPGPEDDDVRIDIKGGVLFEVTTASTCTIRMLWNVDPKIPLVPSWLVNLITRNFAHIGMGRFRRMVREIEGTEYETRIEGNATLYRFLADRLQAVGLEGG